MLMTLAQYGAQSTPNVGGAAAAGVTLIFCGLYACMCFCLLASFVIWIWALIDCASSDFENNEKIVWILLIVFLHWIGAILYFLIGRKKKLNPQPVSSPQGILDDSHRRSLADHDNGP